GYGYIQFEEDPDTELENVRRVKTFSEKPDIELAREFIRSGDFYWNSGIFIWTIDAILDAFDKYLPEINDLFNDIEKALGTAKEAAAISKVYSMSESISVDYGILEKAKNVNVVLSDFGWSDLGTWGSLFAQIKKDKDHNAIVGKNVILSNCSDNMISVPEEKLVVMQGLNDFILVDTNDVLLICPKADEQKIKQIVNDLKMNKNGHFV